MPREHEVGRCPRYAYPLLMIGCRQVDPLFLSTHRGGIVIGGKACMVRKEGVILRLGFPRNRQKQYHNDYGMGESGYFLFHLFTTSSGVGLVFPLLYTWRKKGALQLLFAERREQRGYECVECYACGDAHVERMLGAILRDLDAPFGEGNHFVAHAMHFVPDDQRHFVFGR